MIRPHELTHWVGTDGKHKNKGVNDILLLATARSEDFFFIGIPLLHDIDTIIIFTSLEQHSTADEYMQK